MKIFTIGIDGAESSSLFGEERLVNLRRLMEVGCFGLLKSEQTLNEADAWASLLTSQPAESYQGEGTVPEPTVSADQELQKYAVWQQVEEQGGKAIVLWDTQEAGEQTSQEVFNNSQAHFEQARHKLQAEEWNYFQVVDGGLKRLQAGAASDKIQEQAINDYYLYLDEQVGTLLELLSDETLVLLVSTYGVAGQGCFILASSNNPLTGEVEEVSLLEIAPTLLELGGYPIPETMQGVSLVAGKALDLLDSGDLSEEEEKLLHERLSGLGYI
jgi:predicted AlkP superfamily phosphohydrolase/phosphomutase